MNNEAENNEEVEEERDIIDMLAMQSEDDDDNDTEIDDDDTESLEKRINNKNKIIRNAQQANHRILDDNKALEKRLEELEKQINSPQPNTEAQNQERKEVLDQWRESVADKPENALDYTNAVVGDLKNTMADLLAAQQADFDNRLASIKGEIDPEKNKYRDKLNAMKANPQYADIPEEHLLTFIKGAERVPRGSLGGKRARADIDPDKRLEELKAKFKAQYSNG